MGEYMLVGPESQNSIGQNPFRDRERLSAFPVGFQLGAFGGGHGQLVAALVAGVARVAFHPLELHALAAHRRHQTFPQVHVLDLAAVGLELTPEELARLDEVSDLPAEYPGWMFARQGGARVPAPFTPKA